MKKNIEEILQQDIQIPIEVEQRIEDTLAQLGKSSKKEKSDTINRSIRKRRIKRTWKKNLAAAVLMLVILGGVTTTVVAAVKRWNADIVKKFEISEEQQIQLEKSKVTIPLEEEVSQTIDGTTVSLEQVLATDNYMYFYFKITAPDNIVLTQDANFESGVLMIDNEDICGERYMASYCGGIPDEYSMGEHGYSNVTYWEYWVQLDGSKETLQGKEIKAVFENLKYVDKTGTASDCSITDGKWEIPWIIEFDSSEKEFMINQAIENTGLTVKSVQISPIYITVNYDYPRQLEVIDAVDENGESFKHEQYKEIPVYATAILYADGTRKEINASGPGYEGYLSMDEMDNTYAVSFGCGRINDTENATGIVFIDRNTKEEVTLSFE